MAIQQHKDPKVVKALMNVCKADEVRKETELIMKPYANWEEYFVPGPISIAILGELACITAGQEDFSINKNPPSGGFTYIRYPESFLTCLMQVSNKGWEAFSLAHKNIDQIRLLSMNVPEHMKTLVQILFQDPEVVSALLPGQLSNMKSIAEKCTSLASSVENKFNDVICLIQEMLEACLSSKTGYEKELEETKQILEGARMKKKAAEAAKNNAEAYCESLRKRVDEIFQDYHRAMNSIPKGWDAVGMNFVESLAERLMTVPRVIANLSSALIKNTHGGKEGSEEEVNNEIEDDPIALSNICSYSGLLICLAQSLGQLIDGEGNVNMSLLYNEKDQTVNSTWTKENAEQLLEKISNEKDCSVKMMAVEICKSVIGVCQILAEVPNFEKKNVDMESLNEEMYNMLEKVQLFDSKSKSCTRTPVFALKAPKMAKCKESVNQSGMLPDTHFKKIQSQEMVKNTGYQRHFEIFKKQNEGLTEIPFTSETKEIDFDQATLAEVATTEKKYVDKESLKEKMDNTLEKVQLSHSKSKSCTGTQVFAPKAPKPAKHLKSVNQPGMLPGTHTKIMQSQDMVENTEYQRHFENFKKKNEGLTEIPFTSETKEIDFDQATLAEVATTEKKNVDKESLKEKMDNTLEKVQLSDSKSKSCTGTQVFTPKAPKPAKHQKSVKQPGMLPGTHTKIMQSQDMVENTEYQRHFENFKKKNEGLTEIHFTSETKEIDFDQATLAEVVTTEKKNVDKESLNEKMENMLKKLELSDSKSKSCTGTPVFAPKAPKMAKCQESVNQPGMLSATHFKIIQSQEMVENTAYRRHFENFKKKNEGLTEIPFTSETKEIDFDQATLAEVATTEKKYVDKESLKEKMDNTLEKVQLSHSKSKSCTGTQVFAPKAPNVAKCKESVNQQGMLPSIHMKIIQSQEMVENTENQRHFENIKKNEGLTEILVTGETKEIDFDQATMAEVATNEKKNVDKESLNEKMDNMLEKIQLFDSKSKSCTGTPVFAPKAPKLAKRQESVNQPGMLPNIHFKIIQSQEMMKNTQDEYQRSFENFKKQSEELTEILITMRKCETKEIDFDRARKLLIKGLETLGRVKEQWEKMVRFFQMISSLIESCFSRHIAEFVQSAERIQKIPNANYSCNDFKIDIIYKQAFNASNVAHLVHMISETYTEVSSKYLMDQVSSLGRLISMESSHPDFQIEYKKLADGCYDAQKAIEDMVIKRKREFESNIHTRVEKISSEFKAALPEVTEAERKAIEDTVQKGMRLLTLEESSQLT